MHVLRSTLHRVLVNGQERYSVRAPFQFIFGIFFMLEGLPGSAMSLCKWLEFMLFCFAFYLVILAEFVSTKVVSVKNGMGNFTF